MAFMFSYAYPESLISKKHLRDRACGYIILHTIMMIFTKDYHAQCKIRGLKDGGYFGYRHYFTNLEEEESCDRKEVCHDLLLQSSENMLATLTS